MFFYQTSPYAYDLSPYAYDRSPYTYDLSTSDDEFPVFDLNQKTIKKSQVQTERLLFIFVTIIIHLYSETAHRKKPVYSK